MWRKPYWKKGYYIDNHEKYNCLDCGKDFIVGKELLKSCRHGYPVCPYCGSDIVEDIAGTDDEQLEELADIMGCLWIYIDTGQNRDRQIVKQNSAIKHKDKINGLKSWIREKVKIRRKKGCRKE